jgi:hypothetical protein
VELASRRERRKLWLMYDMDTPVLYVLFISPSCSCCYQLPCSKKTQKWLQCPRCRLSLYQSPFIPSVINLWNSLDNETRNTRTFDTFKINLQRKVVLSKIPGHFLVCDRRSNNLYARLRHNYSSLKYYLFRSNIVTYHILVDDKAKILPCNKTFSFD